MKPAAVIDFGNQLYNDLFRPRLKKLVFIDRDNASDKVELTFRNDDMVLTDWYPPGLSVAFRLGWAHKLSRPRTLKIKRMKLKGTSDLVVEGLSAEAEMDKEQKTRTFEDVNYAAIADFIASENGYSPELTIIEDDDVFYDTVPQMGETDAHFLRRLAKELDYAFWADEGEFHFHPRKYGEKPRLLIEFRQGELTGNVTDLDADLNLIRSPQKVTKKGYDPNAKKEVTVTADGTDSGPTCGPFEPGLFPAPKTFAGYYLDDIYGTQKKYQVGNEIVIYPDGQPVTIGEASETQTKQEPTTAQSDDEAQQEADTTLKKKKNRRIKFTLKLKPGDPSWLAKQVVELRGARILDGPIYVKQAMHTVDSKTYEVELKVIKGYLGKKPKKGAAAAETETTEGEPNKGTAGAGYDTHVQFYDTGLTEVWQVEKDPAPKKLKGGYY